MAIAYSVTTPQRVRFTVLPAVTECVEEDFYRRPVHLPNRDRRSPKLQKVEVLTGRRRTPRGK